MPLRGRGIPPTEKATVRDAKGLTLDHAAATPVWRASIDGDALRLGRLGAVEVHGEDPKAADADEDTDDECEDKGTHRRTCGPRSRIG
jgi:hypothetical protein